MYNSRRRIPAGTKLNAVSPGKLGDPVVSGLILEQTLSDFLDVYKRQVEELYCLEENLKEEDQKYEKL